MIISHVKCASPKLCINYPTAPMLKKTRRHPHIILTQLINASRTLSPISAIVSGRWVFICVLSILWLRLGPLLGVNRAARPLAGVTIKGVWGVVAKISRSARGRQRKSVGEYRQTNRLWQRESSAPRHRHGAPAAPGPERVANEQSRCDAVAIPPSKWRWRKSANKLWAITPSRKNAVWVLS